MIQLFIEKAQKDNALKKAISQACEIARARAETKKILKMRAEQLHLCTNSQQSSEHGGAADSQVDKSTEFDSKFEHSSEDLKPVIDRQTYEKRTGDIINSIIQKCKQRIRENEHDREAWKMYLQYVKVQNEGDVIPSSMCHFVNVATSTQ